MEQKNKREMFSTGFAIFFATLGSAVGLGNIWKFPYLLGTNGGGAFLLVYLLCVVLVGIPIMACEFYIGRKARKNAVGAFKKLKASKGWRTIGFMGVASAFLIAFFYSCVAGWVYSYVFKAIRGDLVGVTSVTAKSKFMSTLIGPFSPLIWQLIVLIVVSVILIAGVKKGIERITKTLMPVLFVLIIICDIRALTLPGASQGLKFLFHVDFSQLTGPVILAALGLSFFKLSLGMGTMITYGSYFTKDNNMIATSIKVALSDSLISILAGIAIFPAVFSFGMKPSEGPGLLFMTIPLVFSKIPFGNILLVAFFFLTAIAATTAMISMVQVAVAYFSEERGMGRVKSVLFPTSIMMIVGILATLSADPTSILSNIHVLGQKGFFDSFDYLSSNILLPVGGLLIAIYVGYFAKKEDFKLELSNQGTLNNDFVLNIIFVFIKYISPLLLVIVFLNSIGFIKF
ncbi:sodium-dependent transporter [Clostridium algoriphilum]|uniref:sodium-dependent transporter n=1 Tax=Clostridium algoriphilum TaxID=198347 RepID=UPI001CF35D59|nr:sodium-dependent transporter [Clostridium algoriphilum]MCB2294746.1 sodium-dependent transporter [Clostridium algoriphilum]